MTAKSIGERMQRAKSPAVRREVATDWADNWRRDHERTLAEIENALRYSDVATAGRYLGQLKALNAKAMSALPRVIDRLVEDLE